jgi:hypothetical protein
MDAELARDRVTLRRTPVDELPAEAEAALTYLNAKDAASFRRKFRSQANDARKRDHTYLELVAGVYFASLGFTPLYEQALGGLTPDWQLENGEGKSVFFADVLTFHMAESVEREQDRQIAERRSFGGWLPASHERLYGRLQEKATRHKAVADETGLPFVVAVFAPFNAFLQPVEVRFCLDGEQGLFALYPHLSGVYHFENIMTLEHGQAYVFQFHRNPGATHPIDLQDGFVPRPIPAR